MSYLLNGIAIILILGGLIFFFGSAVGLLRLPDFYTRMHAAGKGDTLSTALILGGFALHSLTLVPWGAEWTYVIAGAVVFVKILAICMFIMTTSPTSTHALMEAGYEDGIPPMIDEGGVNLLDDDFDPGERVVPRPPGKTSRDLS